MGMQEEAYSVFCDVFKLKMTKEVFFHKHYGNPRALKEPIQCYHEDGRIAGINAFMGMDLIENGKTHFLSQSNDTAVLPEFRGKHIFTKIITRQETKDRESEFIFGIPNSNSYPGFIKMGWSKKCEFTCLIKFTRIWNLLLGKSFLGKILDRLIERMINIFGIKLNGDEIIEHGKGCFFTKEELKSINQNIEVGFVRSNEYFKWKTEKKKDQIEYRILRRSNQLVGYILFHRVKKRKGLCAVIDDFYIMENDQSILKKMLNSFWTEVDMIQNPLVNVKSIDMKLFLSAGFIDYSKIQRSYKKMVLLVSPRGEKADFMEKLQMRNIDFDVYLND